jgi:hypothetical protein
VAFIDDQWASVLKPDFEIIDNKIELKKLIQEEVAQEEVAQEE